MDVRSMAMGINISQQEEEGSFLLKLKQYITLSPQKGAKNPKDLKLKLQCNQQNQPAKHKNPRISYVCTGK